MEASRLTITRRTMKNGERMMDILKFLQENQEKNPRFLKDTTIKHLAKCYVASRGGTVDTIKATIGRLIRKNVISVSRISSGRNARANYRINYLYPGLPQELVNKASAEDKKFIEDIYARLKQKQDAGENSTLDRENALIITKPTPDPVPTPMPAPDPTPEPVKIEEPKVIPITAPVEVDRRGGNISITINLNLNGVN